MREEIKQRIEQIRRGEVPEGYKRTKAGVVPIEWEETRLARYLVVNSDKNIGLQYGKDDVFSISGELGIVNQIELLGRSYAGVSVEPYGIVYPDNVVYTKSPLKANPYGIIKTNKTGKTGIVSTLYAIFRCNDNVCPDFVQSYFELDQNLNNYLYPIVNIGAKHDMKISDENSLKGWVVFPPLDEQKKIAEILAAQDNIVDLYARKIEKLEKQKKAFMQKMFPQKGESVPRFRFPQFTDPWEERKFGTMFKRRTERNNGQFDNTRWISVAKMYFQEAKKVSSNNIDTRTYVMRRGDIAFEGHSNTEYKYGRFVANDIGDGVISELFPIYMHIDEHDESYWKYAIQIENIMAPKLLRCIEISYTSSNKLDEDFFLRESVLVPSISEQQQIGLFFRSMDNLIKVNQQKLAQEKQKKKALMQLLLTGIVRV